MESNRIAPQAAPAPTARKTSSGVADDQIAEGSQGFMAVLASLGAPAAEVDISAPLTPLDPSTMLPGNGAPGMSEAGGGIADVDSFQSFAIDNLAPEASSEIQDLMPFMGGLLQGQQALMNAGGGAAYDGALVAARAVALGHAHGMVAETGQKDKLTAFQDGSTQSLFNGSGRTLQRIQSAMGALRSAASLPAAPGKEAGATDPSAITQSTGSTAQAIGLAAATVLQSTVSVGMAAHLQRGEQFAGLAALDNPSGGLDSAALGGSVHVPGNGFSSSEPGSRDAAGGRDGAWSFGDALGVSRELQGTEESQFFAEQGMTAAEDQLAHEVTYWINQKTQNAELTLTKDGKPIEVSVSLQGNEAHISFHSDQEGTRELLDQGLAQLRDLLQQEGLTLAGFSVGSSAERRSADAQAGQHRGNPEGRKLQTAVTTSQAGAASVQNARLPAGAVDVFV